jgi:hypothetical protein
VYELSYIYQYGLGTLVFVAGTVVCIRAGVLDLSDRRERLAWAMATGGLVAYAVFHALFQFVFPFMG